MSSQLSRCGSIHAPHSKCCQSQTPYEVITLVLSQVPTVTSSVCYKFRLPMYIRSLGTRPPMHTVATHGVHRWFQLTQFTHGISRVSTECERAVHTVHNGIPMVCIVCERVVPQVKTNVSDYRSQAPAVHVFRSLGTQTPMHTVATHCVH